MDVETLTPTPTPEQIIEQQRNLITNLAHLAVEHAPSLPRISLPRKWVAGIAGVGLALGVVSAADASPVHESVNDAGAKVEHAAGKKHNHNVFSDSVIGKVSFIASSTGLLGKPKENAPRADSADAGSGQGSEGSTSSTSSSPASEAAKAAALKEALKESTHYAKVYPYSVILWQAFPETRHPHPKGAHVWGHVKEDTSGQFRDDFYYNLSPDAHECALMLSYRSGGEAYVSFPKPNDHTKTSGHYKPPVSTPSASITVFAAPKNQKCEE